MDSRAINNIAAATSEEQMADVECPTLCEVDKKVAREAIMAIIAFFSKSLNQQRQMMPEQIKIMAYDMVDEFPNDSFVFVKLFFKKLRSGAFGNIYGTVDELTILNLYRKYRNDIITKFPMRKRQPKPKVEEAKALPEDDERVAMPDWLKKKWGVSELGQVVGSEPKMDIDDSKHAEFLRRQKEAKTPEEREALLKEFIKD